MPMDRCFAVEFVAHINLGDLSFFEANHRAGDCAVDGDGITLAIADFDLLLKDSEINLIWIAIYRQEFPNIGEATPVARADRWSRGCKPTLTPNPVANFNSCRRLIAVYRSFITDFVIRRG